MRTGSWWKGVLLIILCIHSTDSRADSEYRALCSGVRAEDVIEKDTVAAHPERMFWRAAEAGGGGETRRITTK